MNTKRFKEGESISHPIHGECRISFVGEDYVGVEFDGGNQALLKKDSFIKKIRMDEKKDNNLSWPKSTFIEEPEGKRHFMGEKLAPFFDDVSALIGKLNEILSNSSGIIGAFSVSETPPHSLPEGWPQGQIRQWPSTREGLYFVLRKEEKGNMLISIFPFYAWGSDVRLELKRVIIWENRVEAQIEAFWGYSEITFYDTHFIHNRVWYEAGKEYNFRLTGIAYKARPATIHEIPFKTHPDQVAWQRKVALEKELPNPEFPEKVILENIAVFIPIDNGDIDEYHFRGNIKSVEEIYGGMLDQKAYLADVTVMRFDNEDAYLKVIISEKAWQANRPPKIGDEIEGLLWLQGYRWFD